MDSGKESELDRELANFSGLSRQEDSTTCRESLFKFTFYSTFLPMNSNLLPSDKPENSYFRLEVNMHYVHRSFGSNIINCNRWYERTQRLRSSADQITWHSFLTSCLLISIFANCVWCYLFACGIFVILIKNQKLCKICTFCESKPCVNKYFGQFISLVFFCS